MKRSTVRTDKAKKVVLLVEEKRMTQPKVGGKKLYFMLKESLKSLILEEISSLIFYGLIIYLLFPKEVIMLRQTPIIASESTKYDIGLSNYQAQSSLDCRHHLHWKQSKSSYLSLITDAYSKKIVGHHVADNLNTESSLIALRKALKNKNVNLESLIHHSN